MMFFAVDPGSKAQKIIVPELFGVNLLRAFYVRIEHFRENVSNFLRIFMVIRK